MENVTAAADAAKVTRHVHLAYAVGVLPVADALPDLRLEADEGEGELIALIFTDADGRERNVFVVNERYAQAIVGGIVEARGRGNGNGSSLEVIGGR